MECKCKQSIELELGKGIFIFSFSNEYVKGRVGDILSEIDINPLSDGDTLKCEVESAKSALTYILKSNTLTQVEIDDINLLFLKDGESFNFSSLSKTKPLKYWLNLIDSEDLIDVINSKSLTVYFQPILDLRDNTIFAYECLSRGVGKDGELIPPNILFSKAKKSDMLFNLDRLAREVSLKTSAVKNITANIFINFIPTSIYNPENCLQDTLKWARQLEFDFSKIIFEVVETEQVKDFNHLKSILEYYKAQGFRTALDDVGSGYSNLSALINLKPDFIKIDREVIQDIHKVELKQSIFKALVDIAKSNDILVLAEGVETREEFEFVKAKGVDLAQGYYFAKPSIEPVRKLNDSLV